jgi:hypothetical protein
MTSNNSKNQNQPTINKKLLKLRSIISSNGKEKEYLGGTHFI